MADRHREVTNNINNNNNNNNNNNDDEDVRFSLQVVLEGTREPVYQDALDYFFADDIWIPDLTIAEVIKELEKKYNGIVRKFKYAYDDDVFAERADMDMDMTLKDLFEKHGKVEEGAFYATIRPRRRPAKAGSRKNRKTRRNTRR